MKLDVATFLLQWATGGLAFCWVTTRRREVSLGYGWLLRERLRSHGGGRGRAVRHGASRPGPRDRARACARRRGVDRVALVVSIVRRRGGVRGRDELRADRRARVAAMIGREATEMPERERLPEFPPALDLIAPVLGSVGLLAAAQFAGGPYLLAALRLLVGAAFLGSVTDAMLLGHWYLVQPGLQRGPVKELVRWSRGRLAVRVRGVPVADGHGPGARRRGRRRLQRSPRLDLGRRARSPRSALIVLTWFALKERYYSAVMAATGLLYLAILTAFGTDLVARRRPPARSYSATKLRPSTARATPCTVRACALRLANYSATSSGPLPPVRLRARSGPALCAWP